MTRQVLMAWIVLGVVCVACNDGGRKSRDRRSPSIEIQDPTTADEFVTSDSSVALGGVASDNRSVTQVTWSNVVTGEAGTASGTSSWSATIGLATGANLIEVFAFDSAGNEGSDRILVHRRPNEVWSWGRNQFGQLGDGSAIDSQEPVWVPGVPCADVLAAGNSHTLALLCDASVQTWGRNDRGQLGDGTLADRSDPAHVLDPSSTTGLLEDVVAVAGGVGHSVALLADGTIRAWGLNDAGQLGDGTVLDQSFPVRVIDPSSPSGYLEGGVAIAAGEGHTLVLLADGTVRAWGRNAVGQLGDGTGIDSSEPVRVVNLGDPSGFLSNVTSLAAGGNHSVALLSDGTVRSWGENGSGELGDDRASGNESLVPVRVVDTSDPSGFLTGVKGIASSSGSSHTIALVADGTLRTWGYNAEGQLGDATTADRWTPVMVLDPGDPSGIATGGIAIAAGAQHGVVLKADGSLWTWGWNSFGQLGEGSTTNKSTPERVRDPSDPSGFLTGVRAFAAGAYHTVALK